MPYRQMINFSFEFSELLLCLLTIILIRTEYRLERWDARQMTLFFSVIIGMICANLASQFLLGHPGTVYRRLIYVSEFMEFILSYAQVWIITQYIIRTIRGRKRYRHFLVITASILWMQLALLIATQFNGWLYTIDAQNHYHRGPLFTVSILMGLGVVLLNLVFLVRNRQVLPHRLYRAFLFYLVIPVFAGVVQIFVSGLSILLFGIIISGTVMFFLILRDQTTRYHEQEQEHIQMKMTMMLSQIQPHFLFNSLGVIQELCRRDPEKAEEATIAFSQFLRRNMTSLQTEKPIPFEEELEHTRNYLTLAKMRFGEQLQVRFDLETTDFLVPTLTLQPLVENAVQHGVRQKEEGGTVTISTRDCPDHIELRVQDDGPGAPPDPTEQTEGQHVGLRNVSERIRGLCGGTMETRFQPGIGTLITINIPKHGGDLDDDFRD